MARAIKVCMFNQSRDLTIYYIKKKNMIGPNALKLPKADEAYILDADYSVTTKTRKMFIPFKFITYYYVRNNPRPLTAPKFDNLIISQRNSKELFKELSDNPELLNDDAGKQLTEKIKEFAPKVSKPDKSISSKELGMLFNPVFYSMIAKSNRSKNEQLMFYLNIAQVAGIGFVAWYMMQQLPKAIAALVHGSP